MKERVFRFRGIERRIVASRPGSAVLDIGCGRGDNLRRLLRYGGQPRGIEPNRERASEASDVAPTAAAYGEALPWADESFELIYISHVLHHATDVGRVLDECYRTLRPGGVLFVIETVDDSPLMRLARALQPRWEHDEVLNRFRFRELMDRMRHHGFEIRRGETFNWMYFAWELLPMAFRPLDRLTPLFIGIEVLFRRLFDRWGGQCWMIAEKPGPALFPASGWEEPD